MSQRPFIRLLRAVVLPAALIIPSASAYAAPAVSPVAISVDTSSVLNRMAPTALGLNTWAPDALDTQPQTAALIRQAGVAMMRYPGGAVADRYDWRTNTDVISGTKWSTDFDQFIKLTKKTHSQPMITVNYGTGNTIGAASGETGAQLAADWVRYANVTHHDNVKYWEIGNEVYNNGTYGSGGETDDHCDATKDNCGPDVYAQQASEYIKAMKAVDPTIKVGVVLSVSSVAPADANGLSWNHAVLDDIGDQADFADVHWYAWNPALGPPTDNFLLSDAFKVDGLAADLNNEFTTLLGHTLPIMITETNSIGSDPGKQTVSTVNALFLEQDYLEAIANGIVNMDWWQLHNGIATTGTNDDTLFGDTQYGDYGILSNGSCSGTICEPAPNTPFPTYNAMVLLHRFIHPGDALVQATSSDPMVPVYAARGRDGSVRLMIINDSPTTPYTATVTYSGARPRMRTTIETLGGFGSKITRHTGNTRTITVQPYSITVVNPNPAAK